MLRRHLGGICLFRHGDSLLRLCAKGQRQNSSVTVKRALYIGRVPNSAARRAQREGTTADVCQGTPRGSARCRGSTPAHRANAPGRSKAGYDEPWPKMSSVELMMAQRGKGAPRRRPARCRRSEYTKRARTGCACLPSARMIHVSVQWRAVNGASQSVVPIQHRKRKLTC